MPSPSSIAPAIPVNRAWHSQVRTHGSMPSYPTQRAHPPCRSLDGLFVDRRAARTGGKTTRATPSPSLLNLSTRRRGDVELAGHPSKLLLASAKTRTRSRDGGAPRARTAQGPPAEQENLGTAGAETTRYCHQPNPLLRSRAVCRT